MVVDKGLNHFYKKYLILALITFGFMACATSFPYKWYGLQLPNYDQGKLLGEDEDDDLPIRVCKPDEQIKGKCVVVLIDEFDRLKSDHVQCRERLKACEQDKK